jgi:hypothetical protein
MLWRARAIFVPICPVAQRLGETRVLLTQTAVRWRESEERDVVCPMSRGRIGWKLVTEIRRLVPPFAGGVAHHVRPDVARGNARRASAIGLPTGQKVTSLRVARAVDNRL